MTINDAIQAECAKLISRHFQQLAYSNLVKKRFRKATSRDTNGAIRTPLQWAVASDFNPFVVRKRSHIIAKAIEERARAGTYRPKPALILEIPKPTGGTRNISVFPVADAALANYYYQRMLRRNQSRLGPFSYAYRRDIGVHDAIERLWRLVQGNGRLYLVEFDFSKYFDTIDHEYVIDALSRHFKVTRSEIEVVRSVLRCRRAFGPAAYKRGDFSPTTRGIPQGNSLSLFLANAACHDLDVALSDAGHTFARYADDILILSKTDRQAGEALDQILDHCNSAGLAINFKKSDGISEFSPQALRAGSAQGAKASFDFLGHRFSFRLVNRRGNPAAQLVRRLSMRDRSVKRVREKVSNIIYSHLFRYLENGLLGPNRVDVHRRVDWDLVTCINDLRHFIYGGLPEDELRSALSNRAIRLHLLVGVIGFFPLITDVEQLKALDGWLVHALASAIARRERIVAVAPFLIAGYPTLDANDLLLGDWYDGVAKATGIENDVRMPSFVRAWKYARKGLKAFNLQAFPSRDPGLDLY